MTSDDYLFGKPIPNFVFPSGSFSRGEIEVRKLITELGLCNRSDAKDVESERRRRVLCVWRDRRDREAFDRLGNKGFCLDGLNYIPRPDSYCSDSSSSSLSEYQLELPF